MFHCSMLVEAKVYPSNLRVFDIPRRPLVGGVKNVKQQTWTSLKYQEIPWRNSQDDPQQFHQQHGFTREQ